MSPMTSKSTILILLFLIATHVGVINCAQAAPTDAGPTSPEESKILWEIATKSELENQPIDQINALERIIARYPGHPHYLEAHLKLGEAYLKMGEAKQALKPLKYYSEGASSVDSAFKGKSLLAQAYLDLHQAATALLVTKELENLSTRKKNDPVFNTTARATALYLKACVHFALHEDKKAVFSESGSRQLLQQLPETKRSELNANLDKLSLKMKLRKCSKFYSANRLPEDEVKDQLKRKALCLMEAQTQLGQLDKDRVQPEGVEWLTQSWRDFWTDCQHPPDPTSPPKRSAVQLQRYREELTDKLQQDCKSLLKQAKASLPKDDTLTTLAKTLESLFSR